MKITHIPIAQKYKTNQTQDFLVIIHGPIDTCLFNGRSEEHTSELQSRDSTSFAVFCLKKKNKKIIVSYFVKYSFRSEYHTSELPSHS